jgi:hypothetical protein
VLVCITPDIAQERRMQRVAVARLVHTPGLVLWATTEVLFQEQGPLVPIWLGGISQPSLASQPGDSHRQCMFDAMQRKYRMRGLVQQFLFSALSFLTAVPRAKRFGPLNTMVFTHLPPNVLLILIAFAPTFPAADVILLLRQAFSQMDVPTRQTYTMAVVAPEERTAAARPVFAGLLVQGPWSLLGLPFILAGMLKSACNLTLWSIFRRVRLKEE